MSVIRFSLPACAVSALVAFAAVSLDQPVKAQAQQGVKVDESAIRYYARQGDQKRLEAEIARLRALYPDWTPPESLTDEQPQGDAELDRYWKLFSEQRYGELRSVLTSRQGREAGWTPPAELISRLEEGEARQRLSNASDNKQWSAVIDIASGSSTLLTCANVDSLWSVAEAFARTNRNDRARDAYVYILTNCTDGAERFATIQKASQLLPDSMMADLIALERRDAQGRGEFAAFQDEAFRTSLGKAAEDGSIAVDESALQRFTDAAKGNDSAADALLLGWYHLKRDRASDALRWFQLARDRDDTDKASEGIVLALHAQKKFLEAEEAGYARRNASDANKAAYFGAVTGLLSLDPPVKVAPDILSRIVQAINADRSAEAAQGLGWYSYNIGQTRTAATWFDAALQWQPDSEPAAYGLALSRQRLGDRAGVAELKREWSQRSRRIANLGRTGLNGRLNAPSDVATGGSADYAEPVPVNDSRIIDQVGSPRVVDIPRAATVEREPILIEDRLGAPQATQRRQVLVQARSGSCAGAGGGAAALARGWCLMNLGRPLEAAEAFDRALKTGSAQVRSDAAYGKSLAYLREGLTGEAAVAALEAPVSGPQARDLTVSLLTQRAVAAHRDGRYVETILLLEERAQLATEETGLTALRGWSYFHLRRWEDARRIFTALAKLGVKDGWAGLEAIAQSTGMRREG